MDVEGSGRWPALLASAAMALAVCSPALARDQSARSRLVDKCLALIDPQDEGVQDRC